jgi:hypothetical protein
MVNLELGLRTATRFMTVAKTLACWRFEGSARPICCQSAGERQPFNKILKLPRCKSSQDVANA